MCYLHEFPFVTPVQRLLSQPPSRFASMLLSNSGGLADARSLQCALDSLRTFLTISCSSISAATPTPLGRLCAARLIPSAPFVDLSAPPVFLLFIKFRVPRGLYYCIHPLDC